VGYKRAGFDCITPHHPEAPLKFIFIQIIAMATILCCPSVRPYRPRLLDHEDKFQAFLRWIPSAKLSVDESCAIIDNAPYAVQVVKQVNYGPQESIRYFVPTIDGAHFVEMNEDSLIKSNFEKLNSY
jgi:hypothetical protein